MPTATLYTPNSSNTKWNSRGTFSKKLGKGKHGEQVVLGVRPDDPVLLIEQDAFPCEGCDSFFTGLSRTGKAIVFRVTEDGTGDRNFHTSQGLTGTGYPCLIYYCQGTRSYNARPQQWPQNAPAA